MHRLAAACLAAALLLASPAVAQEGPAPGDEVAVTLTTGATFRGTVVGEDARMLTIRSAAGTLRALPRTSISHVEVTARATAPLAQAAPPVPAAVVTPAPGAAPIAARAAAPEPAPAPRPEVDQATPAEPAASFPRVGLGVGLLAGGSPLFYLPIQTSPGLRVEPEFGLVSASSNGESATQTQVGLGLLGVRRLAPQVNGYAGGRFSMLATSATGAESRTTLRWAAVGGGEWLPVPRVALGFEVQVAYLHTSASASSSFTNTVTGFSTGSLAFLRIFLN